MSDKNHYEIRLFFGVLIPENIREELNLTSKKWLRNYRKLKFVETENIHVTLKFLGNIKENLLIKIDEVVKSFINEFNLFQISIEKGMILSGRIACFQVEEGKGELKRIFNLLNSKLGKIGISKEKRKYFPHVTTARLKSSGKPEKILFDRYIFNCKSIILYRSFLKKRGPVYNKINEYFFKGEESGKTLK